VFVRVSLTIGVVQKRLEADGGLDF
jgi:hypothetical protein